MKVKGLLLTMFFFTFICAITVLAQGHSDTFPVCNSEGNQGWIQVGYNCVDDEYLVVWEDYRRKGTYADADIYGQFVESNGNLKGDDFAICETDSAQYWPRLDFDPNLGRFLVVFEDQRNGSRNGDVRGILVGSDGSFIDAPTSDKDHTFAICSNAAHVYTVSVAFNYWEKVYLVVWGDFRNDPKMESFTGTDVFGQLVDENGTLLAPPDPADPAENFPIAHVTDFDESVADVTFSAITNEFFVVFGTSIGFVMGQRVDHRGNLIDMTGNTLGKKAALGGAAFFISDQFQNGPDCLQTKVQANNEYKKYVSKALVPWCECEVVWKGMLPPRTDNDVYGQRIGFSYEDNKWVAEYLDLEGKVTQSPSNHEISIAKDWADPPEIAFSAEDNEFLVGWGEPRERGYSGMDLYIQRLWVNSSREMKLLADDRVNTVTSSENIPLVATDHFEGGIIGIAHSIHRNEFLIAYTFRERPAGLEYDVHGCRVYGTTPTTVEGLEQPHIPSEFNVAQNYPNPFNPSTSIRFGLPDEGQVTVTLYDLNGRHILTLLNAVKAAGYHAVAWNGKDTKGNDVSSGIYLYSIRFKDHVITSKMTLTR